MALDNNSFSLPGQEPKDPQDSVTNKPAGESGDSVSGMNSAQTSTPASAVPVSSIASSMPSSSSIPTPATSTAETVGFMSVMKGTLDVMKKKGLLFFGLTVLNFVVLGLVFLLFGFLGVVIAPMGMVAMIVVGLLFLVGVVVLEFVFYGTLGNQAAAVIADQKVSLGQSMGFAFKNVGKSLYLCLKIFVYSGLWLELVVLILFPLANTLAFSMGNSAQLLLVIVNFVLGLMSVAIVVFVWIRSLRTVLAFPRLMAEPNLSAKEALDQSVGITKGKWWLVFSFTVLMVFGFSLIPFILNIVGALVHVTTVTTLFSIISVIFAVLVYAMSITFYQVLADRLNDKNKIVKLHPGVLIGAIVIVLAPYIVLGGLFIFGAQNFLKTMNVSSLTPISSNYEKVTDNSNAIPASGFITGGTTTQNSSLPATNNDNERIANLNAMMDTIEKYHAEKGIYPAKSDCLTGGRGFIDQSYLDGYIPAYKVSYVQFVAKFPGFVASCATPVYEYLDANSYALYLQVEDPANGNNDLLFKDLADATSFQPQKSGKYYTLVHLGNPSDVSSTEQTSTQESVPTASAAAPEPAHGVKRVAS